ncbi:hypothetical protein [Clostridium sp.]|uniref:hypothetical protein n=1 Tax=Clostridium sp. TaxID=1506 RepID=UPI001DE2C95E|nr:hypothetical protein [Clostridium sp.]MBS5985261.1 hypothetical protein [Clostridium sp.]
MENNKEILERAKRLRNIRGCIIAEVEKGRRVEINPEVITDFIDYLNKNTPKNLGVADISKFLLSNQLLNLLAIDGYEVKLK